MSHNINSHNYFGGSYTATLSSSASTEASVEAPRTKYIAVESRYIQDRLVALDKVVDEVVDNRHSPLAFSISAIGDEETPHSKFAGKVRAGGKAFDGDSIMRAASMSKIIGAVGFFRLVDSEKINLDDRLSDFVSEFAQTKVMEEVMPSATLMMTDKLSLVSGSPIVTIGEADITREVGQHVSLGGFGADVVSIGGIPISDFTRVHQITTAKLGSFTIEVARSSTSAVTAGGGCFQVNSVEAGVTWSMLGGIHYRLVDVLVPISLYHICNFTLGYAYSVGFGNGQYIEFGFDENRKLRIAQAELMRAAKLPMALPNGALPLSRGGIKEWASALAKIPLLCQPGTKYVYGPSISILGAVIEKVSEKSVQEYMQQEVLSPLGMNSTGFFIADSDAEKRSRIASLYFGKYLPAPGATMKTILEMSPTFDGYLETYFYEGPRQLALLDGGMYSTPNDLIKIAKVILRDAKAHKMTRLVSPAMISILSQNHSKGRNVSNFYDLPATENIRTGDTHPKSALDCAVISDNNMTEGLPCTAYHAIESIGFYRTIMTIDFANDFAFVCGTQLFLSHVAKNFLFRMSCMNYASLASVEHNDLERSARVNV